MGELLELVTAASEKLGTPPEILTGLPVIEMTGNCAILLEQHRGVVSYSDREVCIAVNLGTVCVTGSALTIRVMNRQKIILYGNIESVRFERLLHDKN